MRRYALAGLLAIVTLVALSTVFTVVPETPARMTPAILGGSAPPSSGAWYYQGALGDSSFTSINACTEDYTLGVVISLPAGSATKLAARLDDLGTATWFGVEIRNASTHAVLASATGTTLGITGVRWHELTFSVAYTVPSTMDVEAMFHVGDSTCSGNEYYNNTLDGLYINEAYDVFPSATAGSTDSGTAHAAKVWVQ